MSLPDDFRAVPDALATSRPVRAVRAEFLRRLGHDIASPAGVTLTVLEQLSSTTPPRPELLAMARRSLKRLMRLSEQLQLTAEIASQPLGPELSPVDVRALTRQALEDATAIDGRKDVVSSLAVPNHPLVVAADERLLGITLRELIGNALKLASGRVEVSTALEEDAVTVRIDDDGPGFSDDARAAFGERFVERTSTRGLGLSLSIAHEILRAHQGTLRIGVSSLSGRSGRRGAAVILRLPSSLSAGPTSLG